MILAPGTAFADALSATALAAGPEQPLVLLTPPGRLPEATVEALEELDTARVWIVGGRISMRVEGRLRTLGYEVRRLAGTNRYQTSAAVARQALRRLDDDAVPVVLATGRNYPAGLVGGPLAARVRGVTLLASHPDLGAEPALQELLRENGAQLDLGYAVGGSSVLADRVLRQAGVAMAAR